MYSDSLPGTRTHQMNQMSYDGLLGIFWNFFGGNLDFPKIKILKKVCSDVWICTKCENNAIFKQNYAQKPFFI